MIRVRIYWYNTQDWLTINIFSKQLHKKVNIVSQLDVDSVLFYTIYHLPPFVIITSIRLSWLMKLCVGKTLFMV